MRTLLSLCAVILAACLVAQPLGEPWTRADLIQPEQLAARLKNGHAAPPIFYVGFPVLYRSKHIPGAVLAGPVAQSEEGLRQAVAKLPRNQEIVIYCGCCPWDHCPNVRPAFRALKEMGFTRMKLLDIPANFATDWIAKGYPIEAGVAAK